MFSTSNGPNIEIIGVTESSDFNKSFSKQSKPNTILNALGQNFTKPLVKIDNTEN